MGGCNEAIVGSQVVELSYHDGGVSCWVATSAGDPRGISCVRALETTLNCGGGLCLRVPAGCEPVPCVRTEVAR